MKLQQLYSYTRKAIDHYQLIESGDKIAIGISGGKDSLTLLYALSGLRRFYPQKFDLVAVTVDLGYENFDLTAVSKLCHDLDVPYHIVNTEIAKILFEERNEKPTCSLCAKMRKGALNQAIKELGCNKVAYAHHMDDVIETAFLSMIFEGRFYVLIYVSEAEVKGFRNKYQLPVVKNPCPMDGNTKREYVKKLIQQLNIDNPGVKTKLFHAIQNGNIQGWLSGTNNAI